MIDHGELLDVELPGLDRLHESSPLLAREVERGIGEVLRIADPHAVRADLHGDAPEAGAVLARGVATDEPLALLAATIGRIRLIASLRHGIHDQLLLGTSGRQHAVLSCSNQNIPHKLYYAIYFNQCKA